MNTQQLTERSALLIRMMFSEPEITKRLIDTTESNLYSRIDINPENNTIVLGKTRFNWWNQLVSATKTISLSDFVFNVIAALTVKSENNKNISEGLLKDTADSLFREGRTNDIIDRLFLVGYLGVKTAWSSTSWSLSENAGSNEPPEVNIRVNDKIQTFKLPGSNDPIFQLVIGPKGVRFLGDN